MATPDQTDVIYCQNCGHAIPADGNFCPGCRAPVATSGATGATSPPPSTGPDPRHSDTVFAPSTPPAPASAATAPPAAPLDAPPAPAQASASVDESQSAPGAQGTPGTAPKKPKGKLIAIAAAVAVLALALVAVLPNIFRKDVYVAGSHRTSQGNGRATLWKNNVVQHLSDGSSYAAAVSVFVSGKDVYVAGYDNDVYSAKTDSSARKGNAMLWKNGVAQRLSETASQALSVFVSGNDVYVAGWETTAQGKTVATLWTNGRARRLSDWNGGESEAKSVFVSGGDVYVAGFEDSEATEGALYARLWKNGVAQRLDEGPASMAQSVFVSGKDVYIAGSMAYEIRPQEYVVRATLWKNGQAQRISDHRGTATSVFVSNKDVYVLEQTMDLKGNVQPKYLWKNGVSQRIVDKPGKGPASVFVVGNDVYVAGSEDNGYTTEAMLWKNGAAQGLDNGMLGAAIPLDYVRSFAYSVFVK